MVMDQVQVLRAMCCVAGLDEEVGQEERVLLERFAREVGVGQASLDAMVDRARTDQNFYQEQFTILTADPGPAMARLLRVAAADGVVGTNERVILWHFAEKLGMDEAWFEQVLREAERGLSPGGEA